MASHPPFLKQGSVIGITCPSGYVSADRVAYAVKVLEKWGFKVKLGNTIGTEHFYFSGTDEQRLADLQGMMDNPAIDAILMGRGDDDIGRSSSGNVYHLERLDYSSNQSFVGDNKNDAG